MYRIRQLPYLCNYNWNMHLWQENIQAAGHGHNKKCKRYTTKQKQHFVGASCVQMRVTVIKKGAFFPCLASKSYKNYTESFRHEISLVWKVKQDATIAVCKVLKLSIAINCMINWEQSRVQPSKGGNSCLLLPWPETSCSQICRFIIGNLLISHQKHINSYLLIVMVSKYDNIGLA